MHVLLGEPGDRSFLSKANPRPSHFHSIFFQSLLLCYNFEHIQFNGGLYNYYMYFLVTYYLANIRILLFHFIIYYFISSFKFYHLVI